MKHLFLFVVCTISIHKNISATENLDPLLSYPGQEEHSLNLQIQIFTAKQKTVKTAKKTYEDARLAKIKAANSKINHTRHTVYLADESQDTIFKKLHNTLEKSYTTLQGGRIELHTSGLEVNKTVTETNLNKKRSLVSFITFGLLRTAQDPFDLPYRPTSPDQLAVGETME